MICKPCRTGVHLGKPLDPISLEVCRGDTWCDCAHKTEGVNHALVDTQHRSGDPITGDQRDRGVSVLALPPPS